MKNRVIVVILILFAIGIAVTAGLIFNQRQSRQEPGGQEVSASTDAIPRIRVYYGEEKVGELNGYTMDMDMTSLRDILIPVAPDRKVPLQIKTNKNKIQKISYEVKDMEDDRLIDSGEISDWKEKDDTISCEYVASTILETGTECYLTFHMVTDKHEAIHYYTRMLMTPEEFVGDQMQFAKEFSDKTFHEESAGDLAAYLEQSAVASNDNLGKITIQNSYSMLIWSTMHPTKEGGTSIQAKEFCIKNNGEAGTYTMNYRIKATNAQKVEETYNVSETITVWSYNGNQYVLAYDREVNQVWEATENNVGNAFIDLGVQNITEIEHAESSNQQYVAFAINGDVYVMDIKQKQIQPVYRLQASGAEQLRRTKARVMKVDDDGNVDYMIYGYSPSSQHVGRNGISILRFTREKNASIESAFIPSTVSADMLDTQLSELCYVGDGTLYIMLNNTIYYTNLETREWGVLMADMESGSLAISEDGTTIAYNTTGKREGSDSITVVDLSNGQKNLIEAGEGKQITVCGYTGANLVYGIGKRTKPGKYSFFPISKLEIKDKDLNTIKSYGKKNVLICEVEITENIINMKRWQNGKEIAEDQLLENTEDAIRVASTSYYMDDIKQRELAISFTNNLDAALELTILEEGTVTFVQNVEVDASVEQSEEKQYYVYGYGRLQGIYTSEKKAAEAARAVYGLVADKNGSKIWVFEENYNG